jgi:prephenate dehydrogenase
MAKSKQKPIAGIDGGAGMMGSHEAEVLRKLFDVNIFDIDMEKARSVAKEVGCKVLDSPEELAGTSDLIVFATPTNVADGEMRRLIPLARPGSCVTDVTSKKVFPMQAMAESAPDGVDHFGSHPNYRATISPHGQTLIICNGSPEQGCRYQEMFERAHERKGANITRMTAIEADFYSDIHQNLAHNSYYTFTGVLLSLKNSGALDMQKLFATATPNSKRLMQNIGRMLGGNPHVYGGIQLYTDVSAGMIDRMIDALKRQRTVLTGEAGDKSIEDGLADFSEYFMQLRGVLGDGFVQDACETTDAQYEVPGGVQLFYPTRQWMAMGTETYLRTLGAKGFQPYKETIKFTSIPSGALGRLGEKVAVAKARPYKSRGARAQKESATAFYCSNRRLSHGKKGIRFTQAVIVNPDRIRDMGMEDMYETVKTAIEDADKRDHGLYDRIQMLARFDDPILRLYDTIDSREDLMELGPWIATVTR